MDKKTDEIKLRTLKDLKNIDFAADTNNVIYGFSEVVKQEAIKWVKFRGIKIDSDFCEFLNITEEDLNE